MKMKEKEKKHCIIINLNSLSYIYPGLLPISCMLIHFSQEMFVTHNSESYKILKYNLPLLFYYFLPKIFSLIFIAIIHKKTENETLIKKEEKVLRRYHFFIQSENKKKVFFLIFIISLLEVIYKIDDSILLYLYKKEKIDLLVEKRSGFIIFVPLFSYFILRKKLYRHHLFALFLALIGIFILNFCRFPLGYSKIDDYLYHILNILFSSFFALALVLIKYLMIKYIISAYNFLFYDGIFCIINLLILVLLEYPIINKINENPQEEDNNFFISNYYQIFGIFIGQEWKFYLFFFLSFIASFCYFVFNILTLYNFSPYLNVLTDFLTPFLLNIIDFFTIEEGKKKNNFNKKFVIENIGYALIIFGALILNEIIILNFFGLNENTYTNISERGKLDSVILDELGPGVETEDNENDDNNSENEGNEVDPTSTNS